MLTVGKLEDWVQVRDSELGKEVVKYQWIEPILIEPNHENNKFLDSFFPGAQVKLESRANSRFVKYKRPNGFKKGEKQNGAN